VLLDLLSERQRAPASCRVLIDGTEVIELYPLLVEVTVDTSRTEAWTATLTLETRRDHSGDWLVQDGSTLRNWADIEVRATFGQQEETVFRGYVREINTELPEDAGGAVVKVECQDQSLRLDRSHNRTSWGTEEAPTSDGAILQVILGNYGLRAAADSAQGQSGLEELPQNDTDIRFLRQRAEFNGYELIFYPDEVYFGPVRYQASVQETLMVYAGPASNCLRLTVKEDGHQPDAVAIDVPAAAGEAARQEIVYPDLQPMGTEAADSRGAGLEAFTWKLSGESGADLERLRAKALARANDIDLHRLLGEGELDGSLYGHVLRAGLPVPVDGLGRRLNGSYYVDSVSHVFNADGYRQRFRLLRNAYGDNLDSLLPAPPSLAGIL
jgi:phage protein D